MRGANIILLSYLLALPAAAQVTTAGSCPAQVTSSEADFVAAETTRLRAHFDEVLAELHAADVSGLSATQRERRAQHLQRLAAYRDRGVFPRRYTGPAGLVPEFRDVHGTRCAMGELLYLSGEEALVDDVASSANSATIAELSVDARLTDWLADNGLSVAEAGRIQPGYDLSAAQCLCGGFSYFTTTESVWLAVADEAGTATSVQEHGAYEVPVSLVERARGDDTRAIGEVYVAYAHFAAPRGQALLVHFSDTAVLAYPVDSASESVACSTEPTAAVLNWTVHNADRAVDVQVVADALLSASDCYALLEAEDARLTGRGDSGPCSTQPGAPAHASWLVLGSAALLLVARRQRRRLSSSGRAR